MKPIEAGVFELGKPLKEYIDHHLDVITESSWFDELVNKKINEKWDENKKYFVKHLENYVDKVVLELEENLKNE